MGTWKPWKRPSHPTQLLSWPNPSRVRGSCGASQGYLAKMRELATEHNLLMMLDEIQTGLGRTGRLFAYEHEGAKPDVLILGKALGGGCIPSPRFWPARKFWGVQPRRSRLHLWRQPLGAAVAQAALEVILEEDLPGRAEQLGNYFLEGLRP